MTSPATDCQRLVIVKCPECLDTAILIKREGGYWCPCQRGERQAVVIYEKTALRISERSVAA